MIHVLNIVFYAILLSMARLDGEFLRKPAPLTTFKDLRWRLQQHNTAVERFTRRYGGTRQITLRGQLADAETTASQEIYLPYLAPGARLWANVDTESTQADIIVAHPQQGPRAESSMYPVTTPGRPVNIVVEDRDIRQEDRIPDVSHYYIGSVDVSK